MRTSLLLCAQQSADRVPDCGVWGRPGPAGNRRANPTPPSPSGQPPRPRGPRPSCPPRRWRAPARRLGPGRRGLPGPGRRLGGEHPVVPPAVLLLEHDGPHEPQEALPGGEGLHAPVAPLYLPVGPLLHVVGADAPPVLPRQREVLQGVAPGALQQVGAARGARRPRGPDSLVPGGLQPDARRLPGLRAIKRKGPLGRCTQGALSSSSRSCRRAEASRGRQHLFQALRKPG